MHEQNLHRSTPSLRIRRHRTAPLLGGLLLTFAVLNSACSDSVSPRPVEHTWAAELEGEAGWEHLNGSTEVEFTQGETRFDASASIVGDEPGAARPWHVHFNTCAEGGGIVGEDGDYPRLEVQADGTAEATATVPQALDPNADYHVNVHLSEAEMNVIIACSDLVRLD